MQIQCEMVEFPIVWRVNGITIRDKRDNDKRRTHGRELNPSSVFQRRWFAVSKAQDLDEWSLVGLTREQGLDKWSAAFAGTSRMTLPTNWGRVAWEAGDPERAQLMRTATKVPPPVLVEIAVCDPDSAAGRFLADPARDAITTCAWSGLAGLTIGAAGGAWRLGITWTALVVAVLIAVSAAAAAALWRCAHSRRQPIRVLTADDPAVADVFAAAKILTWAMDQMRIHETATGQRHRTSGTQLERPEEFQEAILQLHRALWTLANNDSDDARSTLAAITEYADLVLQLINARERVARASTVRVAPPAPESRATEPAAERLREAGTRLQDVINSQRDAATAIDDINRRYDETG